MGDSFESVFHPRFFRQRKYCSTVPCRRHGLFTDSPEVSFNLNRIGIVPLA